MKTTKCRSCNAAVFWALTANDKSIPIDAQRSDKRNMRNMRIVGGDTLAPRAFVVKDADRADGDLLSEPLYTSHFATCPNADRHRKPREKKS